MVLCTKPEGCASAQWALSGEIGPSGRSWLGCSILILTLNKAVTESKGV